MKGLVISADRFEDLELLYPYYRLQEEDIEATLASISKGEIEGINGYTAEVNEKIENVDPSDFDFLFLPGGKAPQELRKNEDVLNVARHFFEEEKPVAAICHGPQILISAGLMEDRKATSYRSVKKELLDAGAKFEDKEVVVDGNLVSSRGPEDLPAFTREMLKKIRG